MAALLSDNVQIWEARASPVHGRGLFSTSKIHEGAIILTEQPLVSVIMAIYGCFTARRG